MIHCSLCNTDISSNHLTHECDLQDLKNNAFRLDEEVRHLRLANEDCLRVVGEYGHRVGRMTDALAFYAEPFTWSRVYADAMAGVLNFHPYGEKARNALAE